MRVFTTSAVVDSNHQLTIEVPADVPCGTHQVAVVLDAPSGMPAPGTEWKLPIHDVGVWPEGYKVSREEIYGDDGR